MKQALTAKLKLQTTPEQFQALELLRAEKKLETIGGAGHLFEDTSTQEEVARLASQWFERHLRLG